MAVSQYHITEEDRELFEWLAAFQVLIDPFTHQMMMIMNKQVNNNIPTAGIEVKDNQLVLHYNPVWFRSITKQEANFTFQHEMLHVAFHHCTSRRSSEPKHQKAHNIAADLATNALITQTSDIKAPKGCLFPKDFNLEDKLSLEVYTDLLRNSQDQEDQSSQGQGGGEGEDGDEGGEEGEEGEDSEGSPKPSKRKGNGPLSKETLDSHEMWNESEVVDEVIRDSVEHINRSNLWGNMSGDMKEKILAAQKAQVDWRSLLRFHLGNLAHYRKSPTIKRPNRRFGYPYCGTQRDSIDRVLVAFDTSGSISSDNLAQFMTEVNRLAEDYPVYSLEFDCGPTAEPTLWRKSQAHEFSGRGGTDVRPVFELAVDQGYKSLVILTDGYFEEPQEPMGIDVVWVITDGGTRPVDWGSYVQLHEKESWKRKHS
jgi:predicted metal-dependent peptidase